MLILMFCSKGAFGDDFGKYDKIYSFTSLIGQMPIRNSITMAAIKVLADQNYLKLCYMLLRKVPKFQLPATNSF